MAADDYAGLVTMENGDGTPGAMPTALKAEVSQPPTQAAPAEPAEPTPAPPTDPTPAPEPPPEPSAHRMVPLGELIEERTARKVAEAKAKLGEELAAQIRNNPDAIAALNGQPRRQQAPAAPPVNLEEYARALSLITIEGKPDLESASRILAMNAGMIETRAREIAEEAIGPMRAERLGEKASSAKMQALAACAQFGIRPELASPILDNLPPDMMADPMVAAASVLIAGGQEWIQHKQTGAKPPTPVPAAPTAPEGEKPAPPVYTEGSGGRTPTGPVISAVEQQVMHRLGVKPKAWEKQVARFNTGAVRPKFIAFEED